MSDYSDIKINLCIDVIILPMIANGWKLIWYRSIKKFRLYHLAQDPLEMKPVKPEKVPDIFERLQQDLLARK